MSQTIKRRVKSLAAMVGATSMLAVGFAGTAMAAAPGWEQATGITFGHDLFAGSMEGPDGSFYCAADGEALSLASVNITSGSMSAATPRSSLEVTLEGPENVASRKDTITDPAVLGQMAYLAATTDTSNATNAAASQIAIIRAAGMYEDSYFDYAMGTGGPNNDQSITTSGISYDVLIPSINKSATLYNEAVKMAGPYTIEPAFDVASDQMTGTLSNVGIKTQAGNWLKGYPMTLEIVGPGAFSDGSTTKTLISGSSPESFPIVSTGNGNVSVKATATGLPSDKPYVASGTNEKGRAQNLIALKKLNGTVPSESPKRPMIFDFQPMATSNVGDSKIVDGTTLSDTLNVFADPDYGSGEWLEVNGANVPVTFKGTAYYIGETPVDESTTVPSTAKVVGTTTIETDGPGEYTASIDVADLDPNFITWVWQVVKADQGDYVKYVHADWADKFGLATETTAARYPSKVDSSLSVRETKGGTYLVDDLFVSGFPSDHPNFMGKAGFVADVATMSQTLYFFPESLEVSDDNLATAEKIDSVSVPAKNGFYPSLGATSFKVKVDSEGDKVPGTYVFVTAFAGDDRVQPLTTSATDTTEQYVVEATPETPTIATTATAEDGSKVLPGVGTVTLNDEVCYTSLTSGKEYELRGTLQNKETEKPVLDDKGQPVVSTVTFTPEAKDGCTTVPFEFDASLVSGTETVVFEDLYLDGTLVASHADITDEGQTVETPGLKTTATDAEDDDKILPATGTVTIGDLVCYNALDTEKEYTLRGSLMNQATGEAVVDADGKKVVASTTFTPEESDGCANVAFKLDGSLLAGTKTVVFEDLHQGDTLIAVHADITDEGQTVETPEGPAIGTTATDGADDDKVIEPSEKAVIDDKVCYVNLTPGTEYTLDGTLMDKATGEAFQVDGKDVVATTTFTPDEAKGCTTVSFEFDGSALTDGQQLVVFESLKQGDLEVATHADIEDEGQTVTVKTPETPATPTEKPSELPFTGSSAAPIAGIGAILLTAGGAITAAVRRKSAIG